MELDFNIKCIPPKTTAQSTTRIFKTKSGRMFIGKTEKGKSVREELISLLMPFAPEQPIKVPVELVIQWKYPFNKSETKKNMAKGKIWCDKRSDCDNLAKFFNDCLTRLGFWLDDSQVAILHFEKFYCAEPGISVKIKELI